MKRTSFTPRSVAFLLALTLSLPPSALALRTSQPEHENQLTGLQEALRDPDKALRQFLRRVKTRVSPSVHAVPLVVPTLSQAGLEEGELAQGLAQQTLTLLNDLLGGPEITEVTATQLKRLQERFNSESPAERGKIVRKIQASYAPSIQILAAQRLAQAGAAPPAAPAERKPTVIVVGPAINLNLHIAWKPSPESEALEIDLKGTRLKANGSPTNVMETLTLLGVPFRSVGMRGSSEAPVGEVFLQLLERAGIDASDWPAVSGDVDFVPTMSAGALGLDIRFIPSFPAWESSELAAYADTVRRVTEEVAQERSGGILVVTSRLPANAPDTYLSELFRMGKERGFFIVYDPKVATLVEPGVLRAILADGPHLITPDLEEFSLLAGLPAGQLLDRNQAELVRAARVVLGQSNIQMILISLDRDGALLIDRYRVGYANVTSRVPVLGPGGAGDAGLAKLLHESTQRKSFQRPFSDSEEVKDQDFLEILRAYVAAGAAAVQMPGDESPSPAAIIEMAGRVRVELRASGEQVWVPRLERYFYVEPTVILPDNAGSDLYLRFILDKPHLFRGRRVLEIGTGSGVLAYALAMAGAQVVATDVSESAIRLAEKNRQDWPQEIQDRVAFRVSDVYDQLPSGEIGQFDVVVANSPTMRENPTPGDPATYNTSAGAQFQVPRKIVAGLHIWVKPDGDGVYMTTRGVLEQDLPRRLTAKYLAEKLVPEGWAVEETGYEGMGRTDPVPIYITHVHRTPAGLEERMPAWLKLALGADWMEVVTGVHGMVQVTDKVAVLLQSELLGVASDDGETQIALMGMEGNLHGAFGWTDQTKLRLGLLTPQSVAAFEGEGYRVIRVIRHPESEETPLPWEAIPLVVAEALAGGRPTFWVNVTPYLNLKGITLPQILSTLTDLFA